MLFYWRYVLDNLFGEVKSVSWLGATPHMKERNNEDKQLYSDTADDCIYVTFELDNGSIAHFNSSWCVRVKCDNLLTLWMGCTQGSALIGLRNCHIQSYDETSRPV